MTRGRRVRSTFGRWHALAVVTLAVLVVPPAVVFGRYALDHWWPVTPRLSHISCRWTGRSSFTVSGDITNPAVNTRTFAIRPTFWLSGVGQVAADMHHYETVPGGTTRHWLINYGLEDSVKFGTPVTRCAPYAYEDGRPAED